MDFSTLNSDIFSKQIIPLNTYILTGDKQPELEIKSYYLDHLINKGLNQISNNYYTDRGIKGKNALAQTVIAIRKGNQNVNIDKNSNNSKKSNISKKSNKNNLNESLNNISLRFLKSK